MNSSRDVVITGLGIVSPIGIGREQFSQSIQSGVSGVRPIAQYDTGALAVQFGGELVDFEPKLYVKPRKSLKVMSREIQMGVASATLAVEDAKLDTTKVDVERFGVVYGCPMLYADVQELADLYRACKVDGTFVFDRFGTEFPKQMLPLWMLKYLPNMTASHIGIAHGALGPNNSVVQGDLSSINAIIEAVTVIQRGAADVILSGGAGSRLALTGVVYRGDSNLSHRRDTPEKASRPFDANRDGMVIGEGAATVVLESRQHAEQRGANIVASIVGYGMTFAGRNPRAGMQTAIEKSIEAAIRNAKLQSRDLGHVNAHGSSEVQHDIHESRAIRSVVGNIPVTAVKSYFGNVGAASGALELSASLIGERAIPKTLNYSDVDPECDLDVVTNARVSASPYCLKLNQASTGQATALLVRQGA